MKGQSNVYAMYAFLALVASPLSCLTLTVVGWLLGRNSSAAFLKFWGAHLIVGALIGLAFFGFALIDTRSARVIGLCMFGLVGGVLLISGLVIMFAGGGSRPSYGLGKVLGDAITYSLAGGLAGFAGTKVWNRLNGEGWD